MMRVMGNETEKGSDIQLNFMIAKFCNAVIASGYCQKYYNRIKYDKYMIKNYMMHMMWLFEKLPLLNFPYY